MFILGVSQNKKVCLYRVRIVKRKYAYWINIIFPA